MSSQETSRHLVPLTEYAENAVLRRSLHSPAAPDMPAPGEKSKMTTVTDANIQINWRKLIAMKPLKRPDLNLEVLQYYRTLLLNKAMHELTVDGSRGSEPVFQHDRDVKDAAQLAVFDAMALVRSIDTKTKNYDIDINPSVVGNSAIVPLVITQDSDSKLCNENIRFGVFILPPWSFAPADFDEFVAIDNIKSLGSKSPATDSQTEAKNSSAELMLAHVYNFCFENNCQFWAISTYEQWVFGAFDKKHTIGWTSPVYGMEATGPNIVQVLEYWIHSAFEGEDTWTPLTDEFAAGAIKTGLSPKRHSIGIASGNGNQEMPSSKRGKLTSSGCQSDAPWDEAAGQRDGHNGAEPILVKQAVRQILEALKESRCVPSLNESLSSAGTNYIFTNCVFNAHSLDASRNNPTPNIDLELRPVSGLDQGGLLGNGYSVVPMDGLPPNPLLDNEANPCNMDQILPPEGVATSNQVSVGGVTPYDPVTSLRWNDWYFGHEIFPGEVVDQPKGQTTIEELSAEYISMQFCEAFEHSENGSTSNGESADANIVSGRIDSKKMKGNDVSVSLNMLEGNPINPSFSASPDKNSLDLLQISAAGLDQSGAGMYSSHATAVNRVEDSSESKDDHRSLEDCLLSTWLYGDYENPGFVLADIPGRPSTTGKSDRTQ